MKQTRARKPKKDERYVYIPKTRFQERVERGEVPPPTPGTTMAEGNWSSSSSDSDGEGRKKRSTPKRKSGKGKGKGGRGKDGSFDDFEDEFQPSDFVQTERGQRRRPGVRAMQEVRVFQRGGDFLLRHQPFQRLVKEVTGVRSGHLRYQSLAIDALQQGLESFLVKLLDHSNLIALHSKRITLFDSDIELAQRIRGDLKRTGEEEGR